MPESLQDRYTPHGHCFGCGPENEAGLRIKSYPGDDGEVTADFTPRKEHEAYDGFVNGGIIGTLLDCHSNWAATYYLMRQSGAAAPPSTVTAELAVRFLRPTPSRAVLRLRARVVESPRPDRAIVESSIEVNGETTATFRGTFVAVKAQHPAHDRW